MANWTTGNMEALRTTFSKVPYTAVMMRKWRELKIPEPSLGRIGPLEVRLAASPKDIRKAQRLRYKVFYEEGQAIPDRKAQLVRRDICPFDLVCDHLLVIDHDARNRFGQQKAKVVGTYRLLRQNPNKADGGFYSGAEFHIAPLLARHANKKFLELGRSCVAKPYRSKRTLELLWRGIWAYVQMHKIDVMLGCASFEGANPLAHALPLSFLQTHASAEAEWSAAALPERHVPMKMLDKVDSRRALASLPPLIKGYLRVGAKFGQGAVIDRQFGTTDVLVIMPVAEIEERYITHFGGGHANAA